MAVASRQQLIEYCLRKLGDPVIQINVDDQQIEDRIDDALQVYQDYHEDATYRTYFKHVVTQTDIDNRYIPIPSDVHYVSRVFGAGSSFINSRNMFSFQYQFALSDLHNLNSYASANLDYFVQTKQYLELIDMTLNGRPLVTFSRHMDRLYIWGDFVDKDLEVGDYVLVEVYQVLDPEIHTSIYNDPFIKDYTTALIKQQWGRNMKKFEGVQLPGGVTLTGQQLYDEATQEADDLRSRMRDEHEPPPDFYVG